MAGAGRISMLVVALLLGGQAAVQAQSVERVVVFRDGSVAPLELSEATLVWRHWPGGQLTEQRIPLADVEFLQFSSERPTQTLGRFEALVRELGHERFGVRQQAERALAELPASVVPLLRSELDATNDAEVRLRLRQVLKQMPAGPSSDADVPADRLRRGETAVRGDLGDCVLQAKLHGVPLELTRSQVFQIRSDLPGQRERTPVVERIAEDTDEAFPTRSHTRLSFETDPNGKQIEAGTNIEKLFIPAGCTFRTSVEGAYVSVNNYDVGGRSGGLSCATHQPRFQGEMTVRFCLPSFPAIPAGVRQVGFWIAAVSPNGTALEAYDHQDRLLGSVLTTSRNKDFLALRSSVPMAYIKIVPNPQIDPDYTIDDLVFTRPQPFSDGAAKHYTAWLASGGRLHCERVALTEQDVILENLALGLKQISVPRKQVARLSTPTAAWAAAVPPPGCWVRLGDGSVLRAPEINGRLHEPRGEAAALDTASVVALWGDTTHYREPTADSFPVLYHGSSAQRFEQYTFEASQLQLTGAETDNIPYRSAPMVWFSRPAKFDPDHPRLELVSGERLMLGERHRFVGWGSRHVTVRRGGQTLEIPLVEIRSLILP